MDKVKVFEREIGYLKNPKYKENIKILIQLLPDYFFEIPASSTGKYHPSFALGEGGLVRHTKVVVRMGHELLENDCIGYSYTDSEKDMMLMAMMSKPLARKAMRVSRERPVRKAPRATRSSARSIIAIRLM